MHALYTFVWPFICVHLFVAFHLDLLSAMGASERGNHNRAVHFPPSPPRRFTPLLNPFILPRQFGILPPFGRFPHRRRRRRRRRRLSFRLQKVVPRRERNRRRVRAAPSLTHSRRRRRRLRCSLTQCSWYGRNRGSRHSVRPSARLSVRHPSFAVLRLAEFDP